MRNRNHRRVPGSGIVSCHFTISYVSTVPTLNRTKINGKRNAACDVPVPTLVETEPCAADVAT
jgi:hypothetical protein